MNKTAKIVILTINILLCAAITLLTVFFMDGWGVLARVVFYCVSAAGAVVAVVTFILKKDALFKSAFILVICASIFLATFIILGEVVNINDYEDDKAKAEAIRKLLESTGGWGMAVYFLIQVLQVVILPLPALVCYLPGALIWGELTATLIASAGVIVGSLICYAIGKFWGKKAVIWIAGKENTEKYGAYLGKRGKVIFVLMQILPFFPDDILCMIAGLTAMNFPFFLATIVLVRPLIIAAYCYLGTGTIIPFDQPWGIAVWVIIFAVCIVLAVLSFKYQDRVEKWLVQKFSKQNKNLTETAETVEQNEESEKEKEVELIDESESTETDK